MDLTASNQPTTAVDTVHTGPLGNDPLTDKEAAILLAIPRGAERTPNATAFRLPLGPEPTQGCVDVTFSEARSIIARLAVGWKVKLSKATGLPDVGAGTIVCFLVEPAAHMIFHWLAFWALGCTVQFVSLVMKDISVGKFIDKAGCHITIHSGVSDGRIDAIRSSCSAIMMELPEEEHAHKLVLNSKQGQVDSTLPWPEPRRPDPAVILHSSGSTSVPKLLKFSLFFYTIDLPDARNVDKDTTDPRPFLLFCPPFWQSFVLVFTSRLAAGNPVALAHVVDVNNFPAGQFIGWVKALDAGAVICSPRFIRDTLTSGSESSIRVLQELHNIRITGSAVDESTAALLEKYKLKLINILGSTELGRMLIADRPPHSHMRLWSGVSPLILPITETQPDGSRQVQFWFSQTSSLKLAHLDANGGALLKFEPFPGEGPRQGEMAVKWDDIYKEMPAPAGFGSPIAYVPIGRADDLIRLQTGGRNTIASVYEAELTAAVISYLATRSSEVDRWVVDGVQMFGSNRRCTSLVIQLRAANEDGSKGEIESDIHELLSQLVESVNQKLKLGPYHRVNAQKRMMVLVVEGEAYGPAAPLGEAVPRLEVTHKSTLQRWKNSEAFQHWLDGLDYGDP